MATMPTRSPRPSRRRRPSTDQPTLICCKTVIGYGAPNKAGTKSTHGEALGAEEIAGARARSSAGRRRRSKFLRPSARPGTSGRAARAAQQDWTARFAAYEKAHPELAAELSRRLRGELPADWRSHRAQVRCEAALARATAAGDAPVVAGGAERHRALAGRAGRRLGRSHRLEQHLPQGFEGRDAGRLRRQLHQLRRARVRHDRDHERPGAARRVPSVRRHVPDVLAITRAMPCAWPR